MTRERIRSEAEKSRARERAHEYYAKYPDRVKARAKQWAQDNPERVRQRMDKWREENREYVAVKNRAWALANPEKVRRSSRESAYRNIESVKARGHQRRAQMRGGEVEKFLAIEIYERDAWMCGICREPIDTALVWPAPMSKSLDHIVPVSRGGGHVRDNVQASHLVCNMRKGSFTRTPLPHASRTS